MRRTVAKGPIQYSRYRNATQPMTDPILHQESKSTHSNHHSTNDHSEMLPSRMAPPKPSTIHNQSIPSVRSSTDANHGQRGMVAKRNRGRNQSILRTSIT